MKDRDIAPNFSALLLAEAERLLKIEWPTDGADEELNAAHSEIQRLKKSSVEFFLGGSFVQAAAMETAAELAIFELEVAADIRNPNAAERIFFKINEISHPNAVIFKHGGVWTYAPSREQAVEQIKKHLSLNES